MDLGLWPRRSPSKKTEDLWKDAAASARSALTSGVRVQSVAVAVPDPVMVQSP